MRLLSLFTMTLAALALSTGSRAVETDGSFHDTTGRLCQHLTQGILIDDHFVNAKLTVCLIDDVWVIQTAEPENGAARPAAAAPVQTEAQEAQPEPLATPTATPQPVEPPALSPKAVVVEIPQTPIEAPRIQPALRAVPAPSLAPLEPAPEPATKYVKRGDEALAVGDIASARLLYGWAVAKGNSLAAFKVGKTFDEEFLRSINARGIQADQKEAARWYDLAIAMRERQERAQVAREAGS